MMEDITGKWENVKGSMKWMYESIWKLLKPVHPVGKVAIGIIVLFGVVKVISLLLKMLLWLGIMISVVAGICVFFYIVTQTLNKKEEES
ncbi:MAG TPA: hypothetical protein PLT82_12920 [Candidatus Hydrogenedens sp.]|nr:hypothetical protein [Candidatus Hydrogenedens sp.]HPP60025.1 hypothetical protein [Candidatus Hydrogenedens sp.]